MIQIIQNIQKKPKYPKYSEYSKIKNILFKMLWSIHAQINSIHALIDWIKGRKLRSAVGREA